MMIDMGRVLPTVVSRLRTSPVGHGLEMRTHKRDRSIAVVRIGEDAYRIEEDGFARRCLESDAKGSKRILRTLLKREFPRSRKVRISPLAAPDDRQT